MTSRKIGQGMKKAPVFRVLQSAVIFTFVCFFVERSAIFTQAINEFCIIVLNLGISDLISVIVIPDCCLCNLTAAYRIRAFHIVTSPPIADIAFTSFEITLFVSLLYSHSIVTPSVSVRIVIVGETEVTPGTMPSALGVYSVPL